MKNLFKNLIFCFFLIKILSPVSYCIAQNLVPNADFEDTVICTSGLDQVTRAKFWYRIKNSPDYFNSCCALPQAGVPANALGFQYPASGNAYMGLYNLSGFDTNYREIIGAFLISSLQIGIKYFVTFKASQSGGVFQGCNIASNRLGILFSTVDYVNSPPLIGNFSQVNVDSIISDTLNWTTIRKSFIADSSYSFISIGNFYNNYLTDTIQLWSGQHGRSYYYIDAFCISDDSLYCEQWTGIPIDVINEKIKVYPNPCQNNITIENIPWDCKEILVYNITGDIVKRFSFSKTFKLTIDVTNLSSGIYSLCFKLKNKIITRKFIRSNI